MLRLLGGLLVILLLLYLALLSSPVQTYLANRLLAGWADEHGVTWQVGEVSISPMSEFIFRDLFIEDLHHDTLIYLSEIDVQLADFNLSETRFEIEALTLTEPYVNLRTYRDDSVMNLKYVLDIFSSDDTATLNPYVTIGLTQIENLRFNFVNEHDTTVVQGIHFAHFSISNFYHTIRDFKLEQNTIEAQVEHLAFDDHSGFSLDSLRTQFELNEKEMQFGQLFIQTPHSKLVGDYRMEYQSFGDFKDYLNQVFMIAHLDSAHVSGKDVAFFNDALYGLHEELDIRGNFTGTVSDFGLKKFSIAYGRHTRLAGDLKMKGLPDVYKTRVQLQLEPSTINLKDLNQFPLPPFSNPQKLNLPESAMALEQVDVKGHFNGTYNHFNTDLILASALGNAKARLDVDEVSPGIPAYQGRVELDELNAGRLLGNDQFGLVTADLEVDGKGMELETIEADLLGGIDRIDLLGYSYQKGQVDASIKKGWFDGDFSIDDPLAQLDFTGQINFNGELPRFQFQLDVDTLYPVALNLMDRDSSSLFRGTLDVDFKGYQPDNLSGKAMIRDLYYTESGKEFSLPEFKARAFTVQGIPQIEFRSRALRGIFKGTATPADFKASFLRMINHSLPSLIEGDQEEELDLQFSAYLELIDINDVLAIFVPELSFDAPVKLRSRYNTEKDIIRLEAEIPNGQYEEYEIDTFEFELYYQDSAWEQRTTIKNIVVDDELSIRNLTAFGRANRDSVDMAFQFKNISTTENSSDVSISGRILGPKDYRFHIDSSTVVVADSIWTISEGNHILFSSESIRFENLKGASGIKYISLEGDISRDPNSELVAEFRGLNLSNFNRITGFSEAQLSGSLTGDVTLKDVYSSAVISSDLDLRDFYLNNQIIGSGRLLSTWDTERKRLNVDFNLSRPSPWNTKDTLRSIRIEGFYYPANQDTGLQLVVISDGLELKSIEPFVSEYMDEMTGKIHGRLNVTGSLQKPQVEGDLTLDSARLQVGYLKVPYTCHGQTIHIKKDSILLRGLKVLDKYQNYAIVDGHISHKHWQNIEYFMDIEPHNFMCLNTTAKDNELYYGVAFLDTGHVKIGGGIGWMDLDVRSGIVNDSKFYIPLYTADEVSKTGYITFVTSEQSGELKKEEDKMDLSGMSVEFDMAVDHSTEVQLIFDETTGDILRSIGGGNIRMDINSSGDFEMFGTYEVLDGSYMFTYENLFSKKFKLQRGGKIIWNGDPFDAQLDMTAVYRVKAPLGDILGDSTMTRKVDNECLMILTQNLSDPTIKFDIEIKNVDSEIESQVKSQMPTEEEKTKQVFSLLLFNRYSPPESSYSGGGLASSTGSDLLTNQLNNWLSKMDNDIVQVGFSELKKDNVEVAVSKNLLDDRLQFESNVGVNNSETSTEQNQFVGDFTLEYLIKEDGKVRAKVFNRTTDYSIEYQTSSSQTQGVGIFYQEDFNTMGEFMHKLFGKKTPEEKAKKQADKERRERQKEQDKKERKAKKQAAKNPTDPENDPEETSND